jgi:hypothetical protein
MMPGYRHFFSMHLVGDEASMKPEINPVATVFRRLASYMVLTACCACWTTVAVAEETGQPAGNPAMAPQQAAPPSVPQTGFMPPVQPPAPPHMPPRPMGPRPMANMLPPAPMIQKIKPGLYSLGQIQIDRKERSITFPVVVNMSKGLLEYLLVRNGGKTHESLFRTSIDPGQIQIAMLLLGAEGSDQPLARQGDPDTPRGNPVEITASYLKDGQMVPIKPESWIARKSDDKLVDTAPLDWMFTGSKIANGKFMAQLEGSIVAIYHDPVALFDNASQGGENNRVWFVNEAAVPPANTPVTLTITVKN